MISKTRLFLGLDALLFSLFAFVSLPRSTGIFFHQWLGIVLLAGIIVHVIVHWKWIVTIARRYFQKLPRPTRINFWVDLLIAITFVTTIVSGLMISRGLLNPSAAVGFREFHRASGEAFRRQGRSGLAGVHGLSASLLTLGIGSHLFLHRKWILDTTRRYIFGRRSRVRTSPA